MQQSNRTRNTIFIVLLISCIISAAVQTALNTALTPIMNDMKVSAGAAQWMVSAYSLAMGVMVLATAFLIRRFPSKPLSTVFMGIFCVGLLLSAIAPNFIVLLLGRVLQAVGCGLQMSLAQVFILTAYPPQRRGGVMGFYGLAVCAAPVLAPTLAGVVIDTFGWRMLFWGALVLSLLVLTTALAVIDNFAPTEKQAFDVVSMLLCTVGFVGVVLGLGNWSGRSLLSAQVVLPFIVGLLSLALFVLRQTHMKQPFLNLSVFSNRNFRLAVIASGLLYCCMMAATTLLPLYCQAIRGFSATLTGLITMPGSLLTAVVSPISGKIYDKIGIRKLYIVGSLLLFTGHLLLCFLSESTSMMEIILYFSVRQIGIGMLLMTTVTWGMNRLDSKLTSDGTAIISSLRTIAGALGSALFVSLMTAAAGSVEISSMLHGVNIAFIGITILSAVVVVLALSVLGKE